MLGFSRFGLQHALLRDSALLPQRVELHRIQLRVLLRELRLDSARQREIHVVAAEQDVLADSDALKPKFAAFLGDGDQREVGGTATDVDDENEIADADLLAPVRIAFDPGVESRLRLLEQDDVLVARLFGSVQCQLARHGVERRRDGNEDGLLLEADRSGCSWFHASRMCSR